MAAQGKHAFAGTRLKVPERRCNCVIKKIIGSRKGNASTDVYRELQFVLIINNELN